MMPADLPPWEDQPMGGEVEGRLPIARWSTPASPTLPAADDTARRVELLDNQHQDQEDYLATKENPEPPSPRTQTDLSGAVPRPSIPGNVVSQVEILTHLTVTHALLCFPQKPVQLSVGALIVTPIIAESFAAKQNDPLLPSL